MWTARGGALIVRPLLDLGGSESAATIETTAEFASLQLLLVVAAMAMRLVQHFQRPKWARGGIDEHAPKAASTYPPRQLHMVKLAQWPEIRHRSIGEAQIVRYSGWYDPRRLLPSLPH